MAIRPPNSLDGVSLSPFQKERLQEILDVIEKVNPNRTKNSIVSQAIASFKKTAQIRNGTWVDRDKFYLSNGQGPAVVPSWMMD